MQHAILRNSQCWCVDGESKFVLRYGKLKYYRIELPANSEEDKTKVEELKKVLAKILRYEITPCPFKRGFHVELPDSAITPRRKGRWKRRESSLFSSPTSESPKVATVHGPRAPIARELDQEDGIENEEEVEDDVSDGSEEQPQSEFLKTGRFPNQQRRLPTS